MGTEGLVVPEECLGQSSNATDMIESTVKELGIIE